MPPQTLREALTLATTQLAAAEHLQANPHRDAELLLLHALEISRATLLAHPARELTQAQQSAYEAAISRRLKNEPIQYITGRQEFYGLNLHVTPAVLIPRPETEHLVEAVLAEAKSHPTSTSTEPFRIVDIGTGSGAIAIALAVHLPQAEITALDLSSEALQVAEANARQLNLTHRVRFLRSDLLAALESTGHPLFDVIVSNPPYIPLSDRDHLHPQVRDHEPPTALFAGPSGLDIYRRLIPQAHAALKPNGLLALEIGYGQREALTRFLHQWRKVTFIDDLQQIPRVVLARR